MSTHIDQIQGRREGLCFEKYEPDYVPTYMHLTRFYGGEPNGSMLQLTISNPEGYIQLTKQEVKDLIEILQNSFDRDVYPSE